jgi:hypothetical protein
MQKHLATANFNLFLISIAVIENIARKVEVAYTGGTHMILVVLTVSLVPSA